MRNKKLLSICIPTYNGSKYIRENLDTAIKQIQDNNLLNDVEILVSDNCSTDSTQSIVSDYIQQYPNIVRYNKNSKNLLFNGNMLRCCELAKGEYLHFMGDDDFFLPNGLKRIVDVIKADDTYSLIMPSNNWYHQEHNEYTLRNDNDNLFVKDIIIHTQEDFIEKCSYRLWCMSDIIIKKSFLQGFKENIPNIGDWLQCSIALYVVSKNTKVYYFGDYNPILSIRLQTQTWLNNVDGPRIYLNNIKTFINAKHFGYSKKSIKIYKDIYLKYNNYQFINSKSRLINYSLILKYFILLWDKKLFYTKIIPRLLKKASPNDIEMNYSDLDVFVLTYNRANYLEIMLESLCNQTVEGFNIKILNNSSTDNTLEIIDKVKQKYPNRRIEVITNETNLGNFGNFERSQVLANNKYTAVFHDDDAIHPEYIKTAMLLFKKNLNLGLVSGIAAYLYNVNNENWHKLKPTYYYWEKSRGVYYMLLLHTFNFSCNIYKTSIYKNVEFKPQLFGKNWDNGVIFTIASIADVALLQDPVIRYRIHSNSDSNNMNNGPFPEELVNLIELISTLIPRIKFCKFLLYKFASQLLFWTGIKDISENEFMKMLIYKKIISCKQYEKFKKNKKMLEKKINKLIKVYEKKTLKGYRNELF